MATLTELINRASAEAGDMQGTPQQIAWAETLADGRTTELLEALRALQKAGEPQLAALVKRAMRIIRINRAAWWIEHRTQTTSYLLLDEFDANLQ